MLRKVFPFVLITVFALALVWPMSGTHAIGQLDAFTPTPTPARWLTVTAPNGGETLTVGSVYRIAWQSSPNIDKVSIGYKSCPSCLDWIATNIPNAGYYDWTVFVGNTTNTQFTIEIIGYQTGVGSVTDYSDAAFTVLKATATSTLMPTATSTPVSTATSTPIPTATSTPVSTATSMPAPTATSSALWLTVTAPNGGEVMTVGNVYRITWQSSSNIDTVTIGYKSCPSCLDWIATSIPNTGYYDWNVYVGNTTNTQFTIEVIGYDTGIGSVIDYSDAPFTVLQPPTPTATPTKVPTAVPSPTPIQQLKAPVLLYPINGQVISTVRPTFSWKAVPGASSYVIQVSTFSDFKGFNVFTSSQKTKYTPSTNLPRGVMLYWRVRAYGNIFPSDWSSSSFKVK